MITLEQSRFLSDGSSIPEDAATVWSIPLLFATPNMVSGQAVIMDQKLQTFAIPLSGSQSWIKINAGQKAVGRSVHSITYE